jgi:hypothetical protein
MKARLSPQPGEPIPLVAPAGLGTFASVSIAVVISFSRTTCNKPAPGLIASRLPRMILEAVNFTATWLSSPRRRAEEIRSSVALWARARRCARQWASHEASSRAFVTKMLEQLPQRRVAAVLGSGLLRDVPVEALSADFREVRLYDLQHLASVRARARLKGLSNLHFENRDLAGPGALDFLKAIAELDLVISANLMSQIGVAAARVSPGTGVPQLLEAHVEGLAALGVPACLLTDIAYEVTDKAGTVIEAEDLMHGISLPAHEAEWFWEVAPFGELDPDLRAVHRVVAIRLPPAVPAPSLP